MQFNLEISIGIVSKMRRFIVVLCVVISGINVSSLASAAIGPRGSVILKSSALLKVGSTQCGKVNGSWIPGIATKIKSKYYFVSHIKSSQLYSVDAKKSRGTQKKKLLKLASDFKAKASVGDKKCFRHNVSVPVATTMPTSTTVPSVSERLKFDLSTAVALVLSDAGVSSAGVRKNAVGSNLLTLDAAGNSRDALVAGQASIKRYLIAPNDKLYVEFYPRVPMDGVDCLLAEVSRTTGYPKCVESEAGLEITNQTQSDSYQVNDIQFDAEGSAYYLVRIKPSPLATHLSSSGQFVRRYRNGETMDFGQGVWKLRCFSGMGKYNKCPETVLMNPVRNFLVLEDGQVIIEQELSDLTKGLQEIGSDQFSDGSNFSLDLYQPDGRKTNVGGFPQSPRLIPIGSIKKFSPKMLIVETRGFWYEEIATERLTRLSPYTGMYSVDLTVQKPSFVPYFSVKEGNSLFSTDDVGCDSTPLVRDGGSFDNLVCFYRGTAWRSAWTAPNGIGYAVVGNNLNTYCVGRSKTDCSAKGALLQVWPTIKRPSLSGPIASKAVFVNIGAFTPVLGSVIANGTDLSGRYSTVLFNLETGSSTLLIPADEDIEVERMTYSARCQCAFIYGLRTSNQAAVMGQIDLVNSRYLLSSTSLKATDLQSFNS